MSIQTASGVTRAVPTVVHLSLYPFDPNSHPATYRTILGLRHHFLNVVVGGTNPGYFQRPADGARLAAQEGIEVLTDLDIRGQSRPEAAATIAAMLVRRYGPIDAVVGHLQSMPGAFYLARQLNAPILAFFHGDDANIHLQGKKYGAVYSDLRDDPAAFFLGVSGNLVKRLIAFGMPSERTFVQHLGLDLSSYPEPTEPDIARPLKIIMVGSFRRSKGHEIALRAFAQFVRGFPGATLHLIGGVSKPEHRRLVQELKALAERMDLGASIRFRGRMPIDAVAREIAGSDIAIQPSVFIPEEGQIEGIPNSILEAMASGLPVVATRHGGIPEAVEHELTGLLIDEYDIEGLVRAVSRLAADPGLRRRYGRAGRRVVEARFNSARQSDLMAERIRKMIEVHAGRNLD
jgi:colanic acid/amylovoran biosynthesis glycosyltransferase